jgi:hypothetical protein
VKVLRLAEIAALAAATLVPGLGQYQQRQSHPAWWTYASPDATAVIGVRWEALRRSPFGAAVESEVFSKEGLGIPALKCLTQSREMLISAPPLVVVSPGPCRPAELREQARALGMRAAIYKGATIWTESGRTPLNVTLLGEQLLVVSDRRTIEEIVEREIGRAEDKERAAEGADRRYSPLLARAARYAADDVWVVASALPDPLAGRFVPLEVAARGFEGGVSLAQGLRLQASVDAGSDGAAQKTAENVHAELALLPAIARGITIEAQSGWVLLSLEVSAEQLAASLRPGAAPRTPAAAVALSTPERPPDQPQVIRIFGLDGGTREIPVSPAR